MFELYNQQDVLATRSKKYATVCIILTVCALLVVALSLIFYREKAHNALLVADCIGCTLLLWAAYAFYSMILKPTNVRLRLCRHIEFASKTELTMDIDKISATCFSNGKLRYYVATGTVDKKEREIFIEDAFVEQFNTGAQYKVTLVDNLVTAYSEVAHE